MVPLIWAFFSAEVNAGTASAARIAIIAITTSNSMSVNAEEDLVVLIFMWVFYFLSVGFRLRTRLRRTSVLRVSQRILFWGFALVWVEVSAFARGFGGQGVLGFVIC